MNQCSLGIDGLSPSARPFPIGSPSSSFSITASKSEHEESIWGDYNLDLSFLSSDDQRSALDTDDSLSNLSRDAETTKEGQILEDAIVLLNPNPVSSKLPELLIESSKDAGDDSEEDTPCWIGILSRKNAKSVVISRRSTDDLSGFHQLNPLAPQFIPSSSKKNLDTDGGKCEENTSSSSNFPSSSGEFSITDQDDAAARSGGVLTPNADGDSGFVSQDIVSKTVSVSDSRNEFQPSKRLDPLAPVFVPSSAKPSPSLHEKQGAFEANANSISALTYSDNKSLDKVKVDTRSGEVGRSEKIQISDRVREPGSTSSYNAKLSGSSNKPHGQRRLNPLAPQFSLADTKQKAYRNENSAGLSSLTGYPNMSPGSSSLISLKADNNFGSAKWFSVEPKTTLSVKNDTDFKHPLPFHVVETAASSSSSDVKALSGSSPKMDVKKLLTTMHGLSELLTLAHGSDSFNANADEVDLVNSTVQNLNLYIQNSIQEQAGNQSVARNNSYDIQLLPNKSNKLSIRDLQLPRANNMTVDLDVKRKEKYSETVPDSRLYQYGVTNDNGFGQVVAQSGYQYQHNHHQGEEQINQDALFYKSLWLKAEADRCLMVYETSLS
uniref:Uncharacterized protein n=1 Tax=Noccaea caerulescens TaxID=107243 RepID=A0A1J3GKY2_NOCCA